MTDKLWFVSTTVGARIATAPDAQRARVRVASDVGRVADVLTVREATAEDLARVAARTGSAPWLNSPGGNDAAR